MPQKIKPYHKLDTSQLENIAVKIRKDIIEMLTEAGSGHLAGAMGMADIFVTLYFHILNVDPANPKTFEFPNVLLEVP